MLSGSARLGYTRGLGKVRVYVRARWEFRRTAITVIPNLGHPMISRKDENCFLVSIEFRDETVGSFHDVIYDFDIFHVFLIRRETT